MNISKSELEQVIKTLPIGLYIKRGLAVSVGDDDTSYYSPHTDQIVVSYPQIQLALSKIADNSPHRERVVRGVLYHEVSHAFITPAKMDWNDIVNVFEDERMETLLANYYHDVDFKTNVFLFNGLDVGCVPPATDKFGEFYNLVRFRRGSPAQLRAVEELIQKYAKLDRNAPYTVHRNYYYDIMHLYGDFQDMENQAQQQNGGQGDDEQGESVETGSTNSGRGRSAEGLSEKEIKELFANAISDKQTTDLTALFQTILDSFSKRNKGGSSINGYSGIINPRNANREDYKMFDRPFTQKTSNQFGTCHLNLFIDKSGSFYKSEELVNKLLIALSKVERKHPNFTLDVVFCGEGERIAENPKDRVLCCSGGNDLDNRIFEIFRELQKPNTYNYNIALFDGNAFSSAHYSHRKNFRAFDHNNCTIISDRENEEYIDATVSKAKVIYTTRYTDELLTNITNTLTRAFR